MGGFLEQFGLSIVGAIALIGTIIYNTRRVEVDKDANIYKAWKELLDSHQQQIAALTGRISEVTNRLDKAEKRIRELEEELRGRDEIIAGLRRMIAQNSSSTAYQLGRIKGAPSLDDADFTDRLDRAGDNSVPKEGK